MLTIAIIFSLLVALWGHWSALAASRAQRLSRRRSVADGDSTAARLAPPIVPGNRA